MKTKPKKKEKLYQVTGVCDYASTFDLEVLATSAKEAKEKVSKMDLFDPAIAEPQSTLIDKPILIEND